MIASAIKTPVINSSSITLQALLDGSLKELPEKSVLAITSKIVSLCEGRVVPLHSTAKEQLIKKEAEYYIPNTHSRYGLYFTVANGTLIPNAGIDESNAGDVFVLWPKDAQKTANEIRAYLRKRFSLKEVGVVITDSTCRPMRLGVSGIALAYSGFRPLRNYVGEPDLFGRPFTVAEADLAGGLAATAVMLMGEGSERTPLVAMSELDFIDFTQEDPSPEELQHLRIPTEEDIFEPFLSKVNWLPGGKYRHKA